MLRRYSVSHDEGRSTVVLASGLQLERSLARTRGLRNTNNFVCDLERDSVACERS